jgi:sigma-B regulation protein RsbU (phosphoserine phosphatase)
MVSSEFKFLATQNAQPESVLSSLNSKLTCESGSNFFVTMFYMIFDLKNGRARYSSGGHLPAVHIDTSGDARLLDAPEGTPLGLVDSDYAGVDIAIGKGDVFVFYTDGVTEAMNSKRELYGEERLVRVVTASRGFTCKGILNAIEKDVRSFEPKHKQHDDITLVAVKIF